MISPLRNGSSILPQRCSSELFDYGKKEAYRPIKTLNDLDSIIDIVANTEPVTPDDVLEHTNSDDINYLEVKRKLRATSPVGHPIISNCDYRLNRRNTTPSLRATDHRSNASPVFLTEMFN